MFAGYLTSGSKAEATFMDKVEQKLSNLEKDFDSAWLNIKVGIVEQLKQDGLNLVIVGAFFLLSWFFLFAIFLIPSAIGASLLNLKFLVRAIGLRSLPMILLRVIISAIVLPFYFWAVYSTIASLFIGN